MRIDVLDHGYVELRNLSGPVRRPGSQFDANDRDPANSARISFDNLDKERTPVQDSKLLEYLMKNNHNTPIEMIETWWEMKLPIFVARQFVRHRTATINEISGRYVEFLPEFYIPELVNIGVKGETQKQGRELDGKVHSQARDFHLAMRRVSEGAFEEYHFAIRRGIPHEIARALLPLNTYTKWLWKQDLHNLLHFLALRIDNHAQWESQQYAQAMVQVVTQYLPDTMRLFDTYRRIAN